MTADFLRGLSAGILIVMLVVTAGAILFSRKGAPWRPLSERLVDWLHGRAQRAYALACAADAALVRYRLAHREAVAAMQKEYSSLAANSAEFEAPAAGAAEHTGVAVASGCPEMEVA